MEKQQKENQNRATYATKTYSGENNIVQNPIDWQLSHYTFTICEREVTVQSRTCKENKINNTNTFLNLN